MLITTLNRRHIRLNRNNLSFFNADLEALSVSNTRSIRTEFPSASPSQFQLDVLEGGVPDDHKAHRDVVS